MGCPPYDANENNEQKGATNQQMPPDSALDLGISIDIRHDPSRAHPEHGTDRRITLHTSMWRMLRIQRQQCRIVQSAYA